MKTDSSNVGYVVVSLNEYLNACEKVAKRRNSPMTMIEISHVLLDHNLEGPAQGTVSAALLLEYV